MLVNVVNNVKCWSLMEFGFDRTCTFTNFMLYFMTYISAVLTLLL